ncbi:MAG: aminodeoxychorismate/anthranilate synthase component II [Gammaproteobacteria bacterium]|nr:aminodeoxychorismate/anthranilate synthase component II [Gammaproteobacteria bacterium]
MILIIDNYDSFTYNLYQMICLLATNVMVVRNDEMTCEAIQALSPKGIVLSPGPGRPESAGVCIEVVQKLSGKIPLLGVCLGHQAIASAFGGEISSADKMMHGKSSIIFHNRGLLYQQVDLPFEAGRYHSLCIDKSTLPECLSIEAETADEMIMGIKHKTHPTFGVQFHPESILSHDGESMMRQFISYCTEGVVSC